MRLAKLSIALMLIASPIASPAQVVYLSSVNTADLIASCRKAENPLQLDCAGYILGVYDQMSISGSICPPSNPGGATTQAVAIAIKYLNDSPDRWHLSPAFLIGESFKAAFPCRKNSN
jgi:Rap1a immunity proteins